MNRQQLGKLLLAVAVVTASLPAGAAAWGVSIDDCGQTMFLSLPTNCELKWGDIETDGATADEVQSEVYVDGVSMEDARTRQVTEVKSHSNQTRGLALAQAKYEIIRSLNNGSSLSEAKQNATEAVNDFYASQEKSLWATQSAQIKRSQSLKQHINRTSDLTLDQAWDFEQDSNNKNDFNWQGTYNTTNITLFNGSKMQVVALYDKHGDTGTGDDVFLYSWYGGEANPLSKDVPEVSTNIGYLDSYSSDIANATYPRHYYNAYQQLDSNRQTAISNARTVAEDIYNNYNQGEIDVSDVMSPEQMTAEWSSDFNSSGDAAYPLALAAQMGYSTNASSNYNIDWTYTANGSTVTKTNMSGALFAENGAFSAYNGTIKAGKTYDVANISEPIYFLEQTSGGVQKHKLNGTVTINSIRDTTTGEELNSTTLDVNEFATTSSKNLQQQINETITLRKVIEQQTSTTFGGVGSFLSGVGGMAIIAAAALALLGLKLMFPGQ